MNLARYSLHVFGNDVEAILNRLSYCQFCCDDLNHIEGNISNKLQKSPHNSILKSVIISSMLRKQKDNVKKFYSMINNNVVSVYSDFFEHISVFDSACKFYENLNCIVLAVSIEQKRTSILMLRKGIQLEMFECEYQELDMCCLICKTAEWLRKISDKVNDFPITDITLSLNQTFNLLNLQTKALIRYFKLNSIIDEYIV